MPAVDASPAPVLELAAVRVEFDGRIVLDGVDLQVHQGQCLALLGEDGSGRSTLCHVLNRTEAVTSGEVRLDGRAVATSGTALATLRADVALIPSHAYLGTGRTLLDECAAGPVRVRGQDPESAREAARFALEQVGLGHRLDASTDDVDDHERPRVALARALALEPRVLLLDDPTAGLARPDTARFHAALTRVVRDPAVTAVLVDPHLDRVRQLADRVVVLDAGQVVEDTSCEAFFAGPRSDAGRRVAVTSR